MYVRFVSIVVIVCCFLVSQLPQQINAVYYLDDLDNWDVADSQNLSTSGIDFSLPASEPVILDALASQSGTTTNISGIVVQDDDIKENTNPINQLPELERDAEFLISLRRIYDQGITKFQDAEQFMPNNYLSRVDAAKMLSILSRKVFGNNVVNNETCAYKDISNYDVTTQGQVKDACQLGIFRSATLFNPSQGITKGQLIAVLIRMFDRKMLDETTTPRYKNYVQRGWEIGLLQDRSIAGMDEVISRLDVAKLLYKLRNIYLNKTPITKTESKLFINVVSNGSGGTDQALINIDMLRDDSLETLEMKLDTTYYFGKSKVYNYGVTLGNFQVYGYLYASSESITPVGVGTRRVQKGVIQEGSLIIRGKPQTIYTIKPNSEATLYLITKNDQ